MHDATDQWRAARRRRNAVPTSRRLMAWRPRNESQIDLKRELEAAAKIEAAWGVQHIKLGEVKYELDWAFFRDKKLVGFGEFRWREKQYPTLLLSCGKWMKMLDIQQKL